LRSRRIAYLAEVDVSRVEGRLAALRTLDGAGERYAIARSWVEMAHGRYDLATDVIDSVRVSYHPLLTNFTRGVAYLRSGRWRASVEKLEYCRDAFDVQDDFPPNVCVPVHYYLGQAYEGNGESAKAIKEYEAFIAMWHDADAMFIGQVNDARQRLKRLRG
jgi:tetratricopeptide (TPR) repeat protein